MTDFKAYFPDGLLVAKPVSLASCRVLRPYLLERAGISEGSVIMLAVPYAAPCEHRTVSAYAAGRDYHAYFAALFDQVLPALRADFPDHTFAGFADHSPIDEVQAACLAGLGVMGQHGLLLTPEHSSYVFLGEVITSMPTRNKGGEVAFCHACGACRRACPTGLDKQTCLSALTQKKGALSESERARLAAHPYVWGCDICQEACPYTQNAKRAGTLYTKIPYFLEQLLPCPDLTAIDGMSDADFAARAYAWRGREVIRRNIQSKEEMT